MSANVLNYCAGYGTIVKNYGDDNERRDRGLILPGRVDRESQRGAGYEPSRTGRNIRGWRGNHLRLGEKEEKVKSCSENSTRAYDKRQSFTGKVKNSGIIFGTNYKNEKIDNKYLQKSEVLSKKLTNMYYNPNILLKEKDYDMLEKILKALPNLPKSEPNIITSDEVKERLTHKLDSLAVVLDALGESKSTNPVVFVSLASLVRQLKEEAEFVEWGVDDMFNLLEVV